jgi:hypothetical protein
MIQFPVGVTRRASLAVIREDLAWERIQGSVDNLLETVRAGAVAGRDGSSRRNTKSRTDFWILSVVRIAGSAQVSRKKPSGNHALLEILW